jgi:dTDP-3-amino-3,4,6-trideoxy-alpha-D-glucose transaminase
MSVPFLDLKRQFREVEAEATAALEGTLRSGVFVLGAEAERFEAEWARFCGVSAAAGVASGTDALALALAATGAVRPGRGDEVVTAALTAPYTALAILQAGAVPVLADIDPATYTLAPAAVEQAITARTRAIVPVHLYGRLADMAGIREVAERHDLVIVEDAAQAHGARHDGKPAGAYGDAAAFSFYPTKNLGALGDAGAVVSIDSGLVERVKVLREGGRAAALQAGVEGRNSRMDSLQAAVLRAKLGHLEFWNRRRRELASRYDDALADARRIRLPVRAEDEADVRHLYVIEHPERDRLRARLAEVGVGTAIHYPFALHRQPLFRRLRDQPECPVAERAATRVLSLPLYPQLGEAEADEVADAVLAAER